MPWDKNLHVWKNRDLQFHHICVQDEFKFLYQKIGGVCNQIATAIKMVVMDDKMSLNIGDRTPDFTSKTQLLLLDWVVSFFFLKHKNGQFITDVLNIL